MPLTRTTEQKLAVSGRDHRNHVADDDVRKPLDAARVARQSVEMDLDHDACYRAMCQRDARFDGKFFTAVKTTGIYCRPICPARTPLSANVIFFPTAAAAQEAGFRPCLRCRPEAAPDLGAWRGTSNTVSRALALIEMGALDEADVEALGRSLGPWRTPAPPPVSPASRCLADCRRSDPARAARQAIDPRDAAADDRSRVRCGFS